MSAPQTQPGRPRPRVRYGRFVTTGLFVGMIVGVLVLLTYHRATGAQVYTGAPFYVAVIGGMVGALIGALFALAADRRTTNRFQRR